MAALFAAIAVAWLHPVWPLAQAAFVIAFAVLGYFRPAWFFAVFPAALVMGDAYPWTGQMVVREYDSILLGCLSGTLAASLSNDRVNQSLPIFRGNLTETIGWGLLLLSVLIAAVRGWWHLPSAPWYDQLSVYFTEWNAIREFKGFAWGFVFLWMARSMDSNGKLDARPGMASARNTSAAVFDLFALGATIALIYVSCGVVWERLIYVGLFDFSRVHRVSGPIWTMHIGGQHIDALLVMSFPLACHALINRWITTVDRGVTPAGFAANVTRRVLRAVVACCGLLLIAYATVATMSRATIVIVGLEAIWMLGIVPFRLRRKVSFGAGSVAVMVIAVLFSAGLLLSMVPNAIRDRFENTVADARTRLSHSKNIAENSLANIWTLGIGTGLGTTPEFVAHELGRATPAAALRIEDNSRSLFLAGGWPLYVETLVASGSEIRVTATVESERPLGSDGKPPRFVIIRAIKSMFQSFATTSQSMDVDPNTKKIEAVLPDPVPSGVAERESEMLANARMQSLAFYNPTREPVFIKNLRVVGANTAEMRPALAFTCDDHLIWRTKNAFLQVLWAQGALGIVAFSLLIITPLVRRSRAGANSAVKTIRCVIVAMLALGLFSSLFDTAWITAIALGCLSLDLTSGPAIESPSRAEDKGESYNSSISSFIRA